ncbi:MAG: HU family DNA-binding protein [Bacilli bacterium]|nr:HU family DNA-binding protein [Bacilli bacterium]
MGNEKKALPVADEKVIAEYIQAKMSELKTSDIIKILKLEKEAQINFLKKGQKVSMNGHLTLEPVKKAAKDWKSPLDGKTYKIAASVGVKAKLSSSIKKALN